MVYRELEPVSLFLEILLKSQVKYSSAQDKYSSTSSNMVHNSIMVLDITLFKERPQKRSIQTKM